MRLTEEQLEQIKKENNVDTLWSWSRVSSWHTGRYNWYLNYIKHEKKDRCDCIYGSSGSFAHDIIEKLYLGELKYEALPEEFERAWEIARGIIGLKFDRNDAEQDNKLAARYVENLRHFFRHHNQIPYKMHTEDFALIHLGDYCMQGYIDAWWIDDDKNLHIGDWKTSSIYKGAILTEKSGQLIIYALHFMQNHNVPMDRIKLNFNFLKYATITYEQKNGKIKSMDVERRELGQKLQNPAKIWLKEFGYDIEGYLGKLLDTNGDISILPQEVRAKIKIDDCWTEVPLTQEALDYWTNEVIATIDEIETKVAEYELTGDDEVFADSIEEIAAENYFYAVLSEYSPKKNKYYQAYLDSLSQDGNIFS